MEPIDQVAAIRDQRKEVAAQLAQLDEQLEVAVKAAFEAGHTGPQIATASGLSKPRTYQIRDGRR
ncbi:hypothetical protein [Williamsia soli]|uniref:hypothetical protein n=1 Tax=Williamsia soli TaxID=364929 RepID=UPI001A9E0154|nr:hypothetical protein [Williamsia soli]